MLQEIQALREERGRVLVAIDGRCAAGKTTLARQLHDSRGWSYVPMDHFFLRPEQRTRERYETPGENIDHERFLEEVLLPLRAGRAVAYRPFDCHTGRLGAPLELPTSPVTLIEGSYSCHSALWDLYDLHVFLSVDPEEQLRRIALRNGKAQAQVFRDKWIPLEERYIAASRLEERCEYSLVL